MSPEQQAELSTQDSILGPYHGTKVKKPGFFVVVFVFKILFI